MADSKKTEDKKDGVDVVAVAKQVSSVAAIVRKVVKVLETQFGVDIDRDGKVGSVRVAFLAGLAIVLATVVTVFAADVAVWYNGDATWGTAKITSDKAGTATLTVDAIAAPVTGDLSADDINATGARTDSLGINIDAVTNALKGTISYVTEAASNQVQDADYIVHNLYTGPNSLNAETKYAYIKGVADDVTATTEDGSIVIGAEVNSTATDLLTINASGATVVGAVDANNITVDAGAGIDNQAAGTLLLGAATATRVEVGDAGVTVDLEGDVLLSEEVILVPVTIANGAGVYTQTVASASYVLEPFGVHTQTFASATAGTIVWIKNNAATNVVVDIGAGDTTLGDNDTIGIMYLGAEWVKVGGADN